MMRQLVGPLVQLAIAELGPFIVKGDGAVAFKLIGPMTAETLAQVVRPEIEKAMN